MGVFLECKNSSLNIVWGRVVEKLENEKMIFGNLENADFAYIADLGPRSKMSLEMTFFNFCGKPGFVCLAS